jgi:transcriptional regulator with XRE-family HTH domain
MKIGDALRKSRKAAGLTQKQVGGLLETTPQFINDVEHNRRTLGEKYLPKLPEVMRAFVATAMMNEHQAAIDRIGSDLWESVPEPPEAA